MSERTPESGGDPAVRLTGGGPEPAVAARDRASAAGGREPARGRGGGRTARVGGEGARREQPGRGGAHRRRRARGGRRPADPGDRRRGRDPARGPRPRPRAPCDEQDRLRGRPLPGRQSRLPGRGAREHRGGVEARPHLARGRRGLRLAGARRGRRPGAGPPPGGDDGGRAGPLPQRAGPAAVPAGGAHRAPARVGRRAAPRPRPPGRRVPPGPRRAHRLSGAERGGASRRGRRPRVRGVGGNGRGGGGRAAPSGVDWDGLRPPGSTSSSTDGGSATGRSVMPCGLPWTAGSRPAATRSRCCSSPWTRPWWTSTCIRASTRCGSGSRGRCTTFWSPRSGAPSRGGSPASPPGSRSRPRTAGPSLPPGCSIRRRARAGRRREKRPRPPRRRPGLPRMGPVPGYRPRPASRPPAPGPAGRRAERGGAREEPVIGWIAGRYAVVAIEGRVHLIDFPRALEEAVRAACTRASDDRPMPSFPLLVPGRARVAEAVLDRFEAGSVARFGLDIRRVGPDLASLLEVPRALRHCVPAELARSVIEARAEDLVDVLARSAADAVPAVPRGARRPAPGASLRALEGGSRSGRRARDRRGGGRETPWPMTPIVLLMGPTAAGKTDLALRLAERLPADLVSVDSAMVYRGMDIGTGKPPPEVLARAPAPAHRHSRGDRDLLGRRVPPGRDARDRVDPGRRTDTASRRRDAALLPRPGAGPFAPAAGGAGNPRTARGGSRTVRMARAARPPRRRRPGGGAADPSQRCAAHPAGPGGLRGLGTAFERVASVRPPGRRARPVRSSGSRWPPPSGGICTGPSIPGSGRWSSGDSWTRCGALRRARGWVRTSPRCGRWDTARSSTICKAGPTAPRWWSGRSRPPGSSPAGSSRGSGPCPGSAGSIRRRAASCAHATTFCVMSPASRASPPIAYNDGEWRQAEKIE